MARIIITEATDQHQAKCGYCTKCFNYMEVWRKDNVSVCPHCDTKLYHISQGLLKFIVIIGVLFFIYKVN